MLVSETMIETHWPSTFHYVDRMPRLMSLFHLDAFWHCGDRLAQHLDDIDFEVYLVVTEWFLCLFAKSLPSQVRKFWCFSQYSVMLCDLSCLCTISYLRRSLITINLNINYNRLHINVFGVLHQKRFSWSNFQNYLCWWFIILFAQWNTKLYRRNLFGRSRRNVKKQTLTTTRLNSCSIF